MKVLSIQQPWADLICSGMKDVENRSWATQYRGEFLVHASKKFDLESYVWMWDKKVNLPLPDSPEKFQLGGIIGKATITDCIVNYPSAWSISGRYQFVLKDASFIEFIPLKGQLKFFNYDYY